MAKQSTAVAPRRAAGVPAGALAKRMTSAGGKGVSTAQEDNLVPLIYILQDNSPQVKKKDPAYIEGAEAGAIWLRNAPNPIVPGEEGIWFQPCYFSKEFVEWVPRKKGGGIVGRHQEMPKNAQLKENDEGNEVWTLPNGNECVETRYHIGYVLREGSAPLPYTIPLKGTGHSFSKAWMFMQNSKQVDGAKVPACACVYHLKTVFKSKNSNSWHMFAIDDSETRWVESEVDLDRGLALHDAFASGAKRVEDEEPGAPTAHGTEETTTARGRREL
jgi:hypothetical protein